ncbi:alpha/beta-hydrolase [Daldinia sp. FL1419]|nr:alpha/beta-hydrolase [Daldinia sp. FL1419]
MATDTSKSDYVVTADGIRLRYWQYGPVSGPNLVLIPGWAQTAAQFKKQVEHFQTKYRVTTYDHRGHGESDKPSFGYRITRLAADFEVVLTQLDLRDATLVGHSMGSSILWAHWDLFTHDRISKLVFIDQSPAMTANPTWTPEQVTQFASLFQPSQRFDLPNALLAPNWKETWIAFSRSFYTEAMDPAELDWAINQQLKMAPEHAAALLADHAAIDWRDVLPRIDVPVLIFAGEGNVSPTPAAANWMAKQVKNGRAEIFKKEERGSHFLFLENPEKFNRVLEEFMTS